MQTYNSAVAKQLAVILDDQIEKMREFLEHPAGSQEQGGVPFLQGKVAAFREVKNDLIAQAEEIIEKGSR